MNQPMPPVIHKLWEQYQSVWVPAGAQERQVEQTRLAFYSGVRALFRVMMTLAQVLKVAAEDEKPEVGEQLGDKVMECIDAELKAYFERVKKGML